MRKKKRDTFKNWPLMKNPHFLSYPHETLWKWSPHELIIFTNFHEDRTKIVVFLSMVNLWICLIFFPQTLFLKIKDFLKNFIWCQISTWHWGKKSIFNLFLGSKLGIIKFSMFSDFWNCLSFEYVHCIKIVHWFSPSPPWNSKIVCTHPLGSNLTPFWH